jgi:hypothetical protein
MELSPSREANSHSASQEISRVLWNLNVHYRVHNSPPLIPILSKMNPVHTPPPYFPNNQFNIIFSSMPKSYTWFLTFVFSDENLISISRLSHVCYMRRQSHRPWLYHPNNIWWSVQVMKLFIMQSSPASCHFLPLSSKCTKDMGVEAGLTLVQGSIVTQ